MNRPALVEVLIPRKGVVMPAPKKQPSKLREPCRTVAEVTSQDPAMTRNGMEIRIGPRIGDVPDTMRGWVKQAAIDGRYGSSVTAAYASRVKAIKRANEILPFRPRVSSRGSSTRDCRDDRVR